MLLESPNQTDPACPTAAIGIPRWPRYSTPAYQLRPCISALTFISPGKKSSWHASTSTTPQREYLDEMVNTPHTSRRRSGGGGVKRNWKEILYRIFLRIFKLPSRRVSCGKRPQVEKLFDVMGLLVVERVGFQGFGRTQCHLSRGFRGESSSCTPAKQHYTSVPSDIVTSHQMGDLLKVVVTLWRSPHLQLE